MHKFCKRAKKIIIYLALQVGFIGNVLLLSIAAEISV